MKFGVLKVTNTYEGTTTESLYNIVEVSNGNQVTYGYWDVNSAAARVIFVGNVDFTTNAGLASVFTSRQGTNSFSWDTPLAEYSSGSVTVLDVYPRGSVYTTADTTFNPNTAWGGTWTGTAVSGKKQWIRTA